MSPRVAAAPGRLLWLSLLGTTALTGGPGWSSAQVRSQASESGLYVGQRAPDFTLKNLAGDRVRLADFRGHPVLLNFWASWCKPCITEMPHIVAAYDSLRNRGLIVLAINLSDQEQMKDVRSFVAALGLAFPVLLDVKGRVRTRYQLVAVPTSVFVDAEGLVRAFVSGPMSPATLEGRLTEILSDP